MTTFKVLKWSDPPRLALCFSKKNVERTTRQSDSMAGKLKKLDFEKLELNNEI